MNNVHASLQTDTKYSRWYFSIIVNRQMHPHDGYVERHHVIPRCMGGTNNHTNIVKLTAREHYVCHWLLTKMAVGNMKRKMQHALWMMSTSERFNLNRSSLHYELRRIERSKLMTGNRIAAGKHSAERIEKNRRIQLVIQNDLELRKRVAATKSTPAFKEHMSKILKAVLSDATVRDKIRQKLEKAVVQLDPNTFQPVQTFRSAKLAEESTGISRSHISACVHNKRAKAGGFIWRFA